MTIKKRLALITSTALFAGVLSVASTSTASANLNNGVVGTGENAIVTLAAGNTTLYVAEEANTGGSAVLASIASGQLLSAISPNAKSTRLLAKDTSTGTAQTATMLTGGTLSLYGAVTTTVAFTASAGSFTNTATSSAATGVTYSDPVTSALLSFPLTPAALPATGVAILWTAPTSAGTYTVSMYYASNTSVPTLPAAASGPASGVLGAQITVTVVSASAGSTYTAAKSNCVLKSAVTASSLTSTDPSSSNAANGVPWYIGFLLNDAYGADLNAGSIVASATNGGIVALSATDGSAVSAGAGSTAVLAGTGSAAIVRVDQPTAGAPLSTTVTISYNGTTVCTKSLSISGVAATITVSDVATVDLAGAVDNSDTNWLQEGAVLTTGERDGHFRVVLRDSAGNLVLPASSSEFSLDPSTANATVSSLSVLAAIATSTSSTSSGRFSVGLYTCGAAAGSFNGKIRHTSSVTGVTISGDFAARCADDPSTFTASFDKAVYRQGEVATLTVKFLDSKGNAANSLDTPGPVAMVVPFLTAIDATGSATMLPNNAGERKYTFTVGTTGGMTAGTYTSIIDFTSLTAGAATKATPTYTLTTGGDTTTNADVLKSIVALIASINKQIQALQKLILQRR